MSSRSLAPIVAASIGAFGAVVEVAPPTVPAAVAQEFRARARADKSYPVTRLYDRVTDSTRVSTWIGSSRRPFGLGSRVWLSASFTFPGRRLRTSPAVAVFSLESWTPARGGWAFARPRELRVETGKVRIATIPAAAYVKRPVHLFDRGRSEELSFHLTQDEVTRLAGEPELVLKAGGASLRLDKHQMERIRALAKVMRERETQ